MSSDLVNYAGEVPERFVPGLMKGDLAEAEHFNRYYWAAQFVPGLAVLDAGCGVAYGSTVLSGEASSVVGVDIAQNVVEAVRDGMPPSVSIEQGDLRNLRFPDGTFQAVVCFEVIEHVDDPTQILDELRRVLADDGLLVISSPNREAYVEGNPYHHHEFEPEELRLELQKRFELVALYRQAPWIMSAILSDEDFAADDGVALDGLLARKVVGARPGSEIYTVALASDAPLPRPRSQAVLTHAAELRRWMELFDQQQDLIRQNIDRGDRLQSRLGETDEIRRQLLVTEQRLADALRDSAAVDETVSRLEEVERQLEDSRLTVMKLEARVQEVTHEFMASGSWRLTRPFRKASDLIRRAARF